MQDRRPDARAYIGQDQEWSVLFLFARCDLPDDFAYLLRARFRGVRGRNMSQSADRAFALAHSRLI